HRLCNKLNHLSLEQFKDHFCCLALFPDIPRSIERLRIQSKFCVKPNIEHWLKIILTTDLRQQLNQISIPTLFIYADKDSIVPSTNQFSHKLITQYTISESTHASFNILDLVYQIGEFIDDK
ncbi:MAG: alpha/beta fold hydrolase, partial [Burkholderiales bacterium]